MSVLKYIDPDGSYVKARNKCMYVCLNGMQRLMVLINFPSYTTVLLLNQKTIWEPLSNDKQRSKSIVS